MAAIALFVCGNTEKCTNSISANGLNDIQLKALRMWPKTCDNCGKQTHWIEQLGLFENIETVPTQKRIGGRRHGKNNNGTSHIH